MTKKMIFIAITVSAVICSIALHIWEIRKINEFSKTFDTISQIELKRTSLLVLQQQVLQNVVGKMEHGQKQNMKMPDFKLPDSLDAPGGGK